MNGLVKVTLKDGSIREYPVNTTLIEIAKDISPGLARVALAGEVNGEVVDIRTPIKERCV